MLIYKKGFVAMNKAAKSFCSKHSDLDVVGKKIWALDNFVDNTIVHGIWRSGGRSGNGHKTTREKQHLMWLLEYFEKAVRGTLMEIKKRFKILSTTMMDDLPR